MPCDVEVKQITKSEQAKEGNYGQAFYYEREEAFILALRRHDLRVLVGQTRQGDPNKYPPENPYSFLSHTVRFLYLPIFWPFSMVACLA